MYYYLHPLLNLYLLQNGLPRYTEVTSLLRSTLVTLSKACVQCRPKVWFLRPNTYHLPVIMYTKLLLLCVMSMNVYKLEPTA